MSPFFRFSTGAKAPSFPRKVLSMSELLDLPATALARQIQARAISAEEVVRAHLNQIAVVNPTINAVVQLRAEAALSEAMACDTALARGKAYGPLHGVPFTVKDVCDVAGIISAAGLQERIGCIPDQDAVVVARMRAAGAILLGKTNCPPGGGGGDTENPVYGRTNNPYNLAHTAGGSSGGEAAIIGAGGSPFGIGSDSGGSLRVPAHYCGVATLKPSAGRVPATGIFNHPGGLSDPRTQVGPLARSAADLWPAFVTIAGVDWRDSAVVPMPLGDPAAIDLAGMRLAYYPDDGQTSVTAETARAVRAAVQALADAGAHVTEAIPSCLGDSRPITERYWSQSSQSGEQIEQLLLDWDVFRTRMLTFMHGYDLIVCPVDHHPAPVHGMSDPQRFDYTLPFSLVGWPVTVVRVGTSPAGLPIGVQLIARPWRDDVAVAAAIQVEQALGGWKRP